MKSNKKTSMIAFLVLAIVLLSGTVVAESPSLTVDLSKTDPVPVVPGRTADVWVSVINSGNANTKNVEVTFVDNSVFQLLSESDRVQKISVLNSQGEYTLKYAVKVSENAPDGINDLVIIIKYDDSGIVLQKKLSIQVKSTEVPLTVNSVTMEPSSISPGDSAKVRLALKNLAKSSSVRDITVDLGLTTVAVSTTIVDLPFVPVGSTTQKTIDVINSGQTTYVDFEIAAYPDAESKIYKVPVSIDFTDDAGNTYEKLLLIGIEVNSVPDLLVNIADSDLTSSTLSGEITFDITNKGLSDVKLMTIKLEESEDFELLSASNELYIGNIASDDFETARFKIKSSEAETINLPLKLEFKDSLNNKYEKEFNLKYIIRDSENAGSGFSAVFLAIIIIVVIVAIVIYKRRKKKKQSSK